MQNFGTQNDLQAPPPPPPLPVKIQNHSSILTYSKEKCKKAPKDDIISALRHITHDFYSENPAYLISLYYPVFPVIQDGRCCGIVALSMASQLIHNIGVNDILQLAKSLNFTKEGEIFSAYNMATLAKNLLHCDTETIENLSACKDYVLKHICDGCPVLIPYDADKNHFPCSNNGLTAHWATITGLCFKIPNKYVPDDVENIDVIKENPEMNVLVFKDKVKVKKLLEYAENIFLFVHQGKSRHLAAWNVEDLLESNKNLYEVTKKYNSDQLVLPGNDALSELRNKAVILKK